MIGHRKNVLVKVFPLRFYNLFNLRNMSGWSGRDNFMAEDCGDDFPAMNNITHRG